MNKQTRPHLDAFNVEECDVAVEHGDALADGAGLSWRTLISADRTPTAELSAGVCELAPDGELKLHRHPILEVYYFLEGEGVVRLDAREVPVRRGSTVSIPGNVPHAIRNTSATVLKLFYVFPTDSYGDVHYTMLEP
jgi:mannose-6-phosphate isomerase-like protein (cupin superfamily)